MKEVTESVNSITANGKSVFGGMATNVMLLNEESKVNKTIHIIVNLQQRSKENEQENEKLLGNP